MTKSHLPPPILVVEASDLTALVAQLSRCPVIAVDTESNSLHAYQEQVCLVQFSIPGADYLVDPLNGLDISPLGQIFADPGIEKVFHAAEYDVLCLRRDYGWTFRNLFDTMWGARILGWPHNGLGKILHKKFGVRLNKRWQRHDWGRRPLSAEALAYARLDTHYLLPLREQMLAELEQKNRLLEARELFAEVAQSEPNFQPFDPDRHLWKVKGARDLSPDTRAILRELLVWRDGEARRRNRPPFKILGKQVLVALAQTRPQHASEMEDIDGLKPHHVRRYGRRIARAIERGIKAEPIKRPPQSPRPPDIVLKRYEALRKWRKKMAARRRVDPDVVISNATLWSLSQRAPQTLDQLRQVDALGDWKRETYGQDLLNVLRRYH
jgi:ribonuclease D